MAADGSIVIETNIETAKAKNKVDKLAIDIEKQIAKVNKLAEAQENALNGKISSDAGNKRIAALEKQREKEKNALSEYYRERANIEESTNVDLSKAETQEQTENTLEVEKIQLAQLDEKYEKKLKALADTERKIEEESAAAERSSAEQQKYIDELIAKLEEYESKRAEIKERYESSMTGNEAEDAGFKMSMDNELAELDAQYAPVRTELESAENVLERIKEREAEAAKEAEKYGEELAAAQNTLERMQLDEEKAKQRLAELLATPSLMQEELDAARESFNKFSEHLKRLAKRVFVFTVISTALRSTRTYLNDALEGNEQFSKSLAQLRGTLRTAFQPVLDFVIPVLQALINVLNTAMSYIARFTSWLFGTTVDASRAAAEALYDQANATSAAGSAADKAKRQLSGLDEMNTWQSDSSSGGGGGSSASVDFTPYDKIKSSMSELDVFIGGAFLVLGAILAFTGVSVPLGIALMVMGAMQIASALSLDWDTMPDNIKKALTSVMTALGAAKLVIGAILAFSAINIPLGIALMLIGAAELATAAALNWNTIKDKLTGEMAKYWGILFGGLFVVGLLLTFAGALPLGIALMLAGAVGLVTVTALNWNALLDKFKEVWSKVRSWFKSQVKKYISREYWLEVLNKAFDALPSAVKLAIAVAIKLLNKLIGWINEKFQITLGDSKLAQAIGVEPKTYKFMSLDKLPEDVSMLAHGAVIPPNREFLAVLGDQKYGRNLEAPESLIRQIVREESPRGNDNAVGYYEFVANLNSKTLFDEVIAQAKIKKRVTGKNPFALGGT